MEDQGHAQAEGRDQEQDVPHVLPGPRHRALGDPLHFLQLAGGDRAQFFRQPKTNNTDVGLGPGEGGLFDPKTGDLIPFTGRLAVENEMRHALEEGQFEIYYQPQVSIRDQRIRGMEALIRWNHPSRGIVPPNEFIPIAEESGLISPISEWVLNAACRQACLWRESELPPITMAVNLSARQIEHPQFVDKFTECLRDHDMTGQGLEIEITETTLMQQPEQARTTLDELRALGVGDDVIKKMNDTIAAMEKDGTTQKIFAKYH